MLTQISQKITSRLAEKNIIPYDKVELYAYGFEIGIAMALNILTTLLIGILLAMLVESIVFLIMYMPIRSYAGGFHAKTHLRCYLLSILIITGALLGIKLIPWTSLMCSASILIAGGVIFLLAPVEDSNKPLDELEVFVYKKRTRIILGVLIGITAISLSAKALSVAACAVMAIVTLSVMLALGMIKNKIALFRSHN